MHPLIDQMRDELNEAGADETEDRPKLLIDGARVDPGTDAGRLTGTAAFVASVNARTFPPIARRLDVERLSIVEMRGGELADLACCARLTHLAITWATKLADISAIGTCRALRYLEITDAPKVRDLAPLADLKALRVLVYQGGIWNKNRAASLAPLTELGQLEVLFLANLAVEDGGLRPLAGLNGLRALFLSNQFETADYAFLAAHLPGTECPAIRSFRAFDV